MKQRRIRIQLILLIAAAALLAGSCNPFNPLSAAGIGDHYIYWAEQSTPAVIKKAEVSSATISTVVTDPGNIGDVLLDKENERIYWSVVSAPPGIYYSDLEGNNKQTVASVPAEALAIDPAAGKLYYGDSMHLYRDSLDGGSALAIYDGIVTDITIDHIRNKIYWSTGSAVYADAISDSLSTTGNTVASGTTINSIALDPYDNLFYWAETGAAFEVREKDLDGGSDRQLFGGAGVLALDFDPYEKKLYWSEFGAYGYIHRIDVESGVDAYVVEDLNGMPNSLFLDRWPQ